MNFQETKTFTNSGTGSSGTIQTHTLTPGIYTIEVRGARGGNNNTYIGGKGATKKGNYKVTSDMNINVLVGHSGGDATEATNNTGGGGGTFVWNTSNNDPIIIAGGGGGASNIGSGANASTSETPNKPPSNTAVTLPSNGYGTTGGAGWLSDGTQATSSYGYKGNPGKRPLNGGAGGAGSTASGTTDGGFGGASGASGNSAYGMAGGGGGYTGGHGIYGTLSSTVCHGGGGGAGSFTHSSMTSVTSSNHSSQHGKCVITNVCSKPTISVKSKNNTQIVLNVSYQNTLTDTKTVRVSRNGTWTQLHTTTSSVTSAQDVTYNVPENTEGTLTFEVNNGQFTTTITLNYDNTPPNISFPSETYNTQHYEGETVTLFTATDTNDKTIDWDYKVYIDDTLYSSYTTVNHNTLKLPYFENMPESYQLKVEVRARQSADTTNGTGQDIWSSWATSPTIIIKSPVIFSPTFNNIKWYQDIEQQAIISPYATSTFETQHYCNSELFITTQHSIGLTPPLLYTPLKPHLWSYEYYVMTRVRNTNGVWSGWYKSPTVEVQFNIQPNDVEFSKELPPYFIQGETTTVEWGESIDPNNTKTTYTVSLVQDTTTELFEVVGVEEPRLTFTVPSDVVSNNITFNVVAYSDGLYSNPVSSPRMAITDVKIMDCTLDFPTLNTNVLGEFTELQLVINDDKRIVKTENFVDYTLPLHYFRSGANTLTLVAIDRNDVEITRTWKVNLGFNTEDLIIKDKVIDVKGYLSFNYDPQENYVECTELFKPNLDLGVVEHELYGSTPFEGANTITQKLVINRKANDDTTQLRTLKITGAIE